ncbi:MAG: DNA primase [Cyanobacteria bacterium SIG32]|nr:DNA primase [Cyanobacteria bacterium SIG32]
MVNTFEELVSQIKDRLDIVDVVSQQVVLKKSGNHYWGLCPFHKEKTPSFSVNPQLGIYKCFGCGAGGDALSFIMKTRNIEFMDLIKDLAQEFGLEMPKNLQRSGEASKDVKDQMVNATSRAAEIYHNLLVKNADGSADDVLRYLTKRGISRDIIKKFHLGLASKGYTNVYDELKKDFSDEILEKAGIILKNKDNKYIDRFRNRLIIPIQNEFGDFVAFGARAIEEGQMPKYINSSDSLIYNKSKLLYGLYTAKEAIKEQDSVVLMEGYFDVISAQAHGIENCVAACGTSLTTDHVKLLSRYTRSRKIYLSFDTDSAGQKATDRGAEIIKEVFGGIGNIKLFDESYISTSNDRYSCEIRVISPPEGKDPDEFIRSVGAESYRQFMEHAPLLVDFQINNILKEKDDYKTPTEKARFVKRIIPVLQEIGNKIIRAEYTEMVAQALGIDSKILNREVNASVSNQVPTETFVKNVTKNQTIYEKAQKNLLSVFLVPGSPLSFDLIKTIIGDTAFEDETLIIVKSTIDKLTCTVNNVKELIEHLYTEFIQNPEMQTIVTDLISISEAYKNLNSHDFENIIKENINKIKQCQREHEREKIRDLYNNVNHDDTEALKIQMQLRDKINNRRKMND